MILQLEELTTGMLLGVIGFHYSFVKFVGLMMDQFLIE